MSFDSERPHTLLWLEDYGGFPNGRKSETGTLVQIGFLVITNRVQGTVLGRLAKFVATHWII